MSHENGGSLEKEIAQHLDGNMDNDNALQKIRTAGSISISPELFEKLYLSPENRVKGDLRKTFGNPTPVALVGFLLALTPLTCDLMNWRGAADGNGSASIGAYFMFGAVLMILGGIGEFFLGNTFPMVVFTSFGAFWGTYGILLTPYSGAITNYDPYSTTPTVAGSGISTSPFASSVSFFLLWMGVLCLVYMIVALRTNIIFVMIFFTLIFAFAFLAAWFWYLQNGQTTQALRYREAGGAFAFVTCVLGWYLFTVILLASVDFPLALPVGDLSTMIKGASDRTA